MAEISRFRGIIVRIRIEARARHHLPHYHAWYGGYQASFSIDPFSLLAGDFPSRQQKLLEEWTELYRDELLENWNRAQAGQPTFRIPGL